MKKLMIVALALAFVPTIASAEYVRGHYRSNGTYVEGYHRSNRNGSTFDNYSTRGNTNPYTGQKGYTNPY